MVEVPGVSDSDCGSGCGGGGGTPVHMVCCRHSKGTHKLYIIDSAAKRKRDNVLDAYYYLLL